MLLGHHRSSVVEHPLPPVVDRFGVRSVVQVAGDLGEMVRDSLDRSRFQWDLRSAGLLRADLSLAAYAGLVPNDGLAPVYNLFDRRAGGRRFTNRVSRRTARDFRGGRLTYDEHDGTDLVCPVGTPLVAAAPGIVVLVRDRWLRGGLTVAVDHGHGVVTQTTHVSRALRSPGDYVARGEVVALSGAAGVEMVQFAPWVPPHVHFMVFVDGRPVDPFLAEGEADRAGTWLHGNLPRACEPVAADGPRVEPSPVDVERMRRIRGACVDPKLARELDQDAGDLQTSAALIEDALCHDGHAFHPEVWGESVRPPLHADRAAAARKVKLTLPLPGREYQGIRFADAWFTRP